jgi:hypothetical protein
MRSSRYSASIKTSGMILTALLNNKEYAQYDMPKAIKKDYRTVLRHLKLLKQYEMIRLVREEPAKRGGKERKIFGLTVKGLLQALKFEFNHEGITLERVEKIADAYPDSLPLIFGKWKLFRKYQVRPLIFDRFASSLLYLPDRLSEMSQETISIMQKVPKQMSTGEKLPYGYKRHHEMIAPVLRDRIRADGMDDLDSVNHNVFLEPADALELSNAQLRLFSVLKKDEDLKAYVNEDFERIERVFLGYLQNIRIWKQNWVSTR